MPIRLIKPLSTISPREEELAGWLDAGMTKPGKLSTELARLLGVAGSEITKMRQGARKILYHQVFTIAEYIEERPPMFGCEPATLIVPVVGEAGRQAWYDHEPEQTDIISIPYLHTDRFHDLPLSAVTVVGHAINRCVPEGAYAIHTPYFHARKGLRDKDLVVIKQTRG